MLVLKRKCNESIMIGDEIKITILGSKDLEKGIIRIGISAPLSVTIHRQEVYLREIDKKNQNKKIARPYANEAQITETNYDLGNQ
jgi:carbon storage regulator CsrA